MTVISDYGQIHPNDPYYPEYSFKVIGRSFGWFLATIVFKTGNSAPLQPWFAFIILFITLAAAVILRESSMAVGWIWYVALLLPLASLKNHYEVLHYPYPASIGSTLWIAGLFQAIGKKRLSLTISIPVEKLTAFGFVLLFTINSFAWLQDNPELNWLDDVRYARSQFIVGLKRLLPRPTHGSVFAVVLPDPIHMDPDLTSLVEVIYHDPSLMASQFPTMEEARRFISTCAFRKVHLHSKK